MTSSQTAIRFLLFAGLFALSACGGGGGSSSESPLASTLGGTAAFGAAFSGGSVQVIDRSGSAACTNAPVTTDSRGTYTCNLSTASQAPMVVVVTDPTGLVSPLVSLVASKPAAGARASVNVTPLTTAIAAQLDNPAAAGQPKDALALFKQPAGLADLDLGQLSGVTRNLVIQLSSVLASVGVDPATFDPFTSPIEAGSGTGTDAMLDQVRVSFDVNGAPLLGNVFNPNVPSVSMAGPGDTAPPTVTTSLVVTAPGEDPPFTVKELEVFKTEMERCFAVPAATRAPNPDTAQRLLTDTDPACHGFIAMIGTNPGDAPNITLDFLQNGYVADAYFYSLLTDPDMDGAKFNTPELLALELKQDGQHQAVLNIKFVNKLGVPGNRILAAKKFPQSRAPETQSQWWLTGNQRAIDAYIRTAVVLRDQTIPQEVLDAGTFFDEAVRSRAEVGLQIFVYRPNNGSTVNNPNNPNNAIRYVRVKGPGLPIDGIVYADVVASDGRSSMSILNVTGSIPSTSTQQLADNVGDIFRLQRTRGIGEAATPRTNPEVESAAISSLNWAHPLMYGESPSSEWQADLSTVLETSAYTFEAFCGTSTTPCHTFTTRLSNNLMSAMGAARLPWSSLAPATLSWLSDGAVATSTVDVAWIVPAMAERVSSVYAQGFNTSIFVDGFANVAGGGTSQTITANLNGIYPAISLSDNQTSRAIRLQYGILDGSYKAQWVQFN